MPLPYFGPDKYVWQWGEMRAHLPRGRQNKIGLPGQGHPKAVRGKPMAPHHSIALYEWLVGLNVS